MLRLRWVICVGRSPQPPAKWKGVYAAKDFGSHCLQTHPFDDMQFHDPGASEDCLTLNVWTPAKAKRGSLPVMVWIYGGGFAGGGSSEGRQDGQFLAHRDVVVVSMNYRLGIFGFFVHPELTAESKHHASGNYGLLDIASAIGWVKRNISSFGGDPKNITLFGESAGSFAVSAEMASPLTKELISKAIGESGGAFSRAGRNYQPREQREKRDTQFAEGAWHTSKLADLRKISADDILKAVRADVKPEPPSFGPDIDGYFLPESIPAIYAAGKQAHIPLLAGWNADEGRNSDTKKLTTASFAEQAKTDFGDNASQFLAVYPGSTDEKAQSSGGDYAGDRFIAYSTWKWIDSQVQTGSAPVYRYFFKLGSPGDKYHPASAGAFHSDDIEYVFGTLDSRQEITVRPEDRKLSEMMGAYWTNFARTGDPNGAGLPKWPTYNAADQWQVMQLDASPEAKPDAYRNRYLFLDQVWAEAKNK